MVDNNNNNNGVLRQPQQGQEEQQRQRAGPNLFESIAQIVLMVCAMQFMSGFVRMGMEHFGVPGQSDRYNATTTSSGGSSEVVIEPPGAGRGRKPEGVTTTTAATTSGGGPEGDAHRCLWEVGSMMDLDVYIAESPTPSKRMLSGGAAAAAARDRSTLASWHETGLILSPSSDSNGDNSRNGTVTFPVSKGVLSNTTQVYAHVFLRRTTVPSSSLPGGWEAVPNNGAKNGEGLNVLRKTVTLNRYRLRKKVREGRSLLGENDDDDDGVRSKDDAAGLPEDNTVLGRAYRNTDEDVILTYFKPSLTLQLVSDLPPYFPRGSIPAQMLKMMDFYNGSDDSSSSSSSVGGGKYYPVLYPSEFWITADSLIPINGTMKSVTIDLSIDNARMWKWQLMSQMEQSWKMQEEMGAGQEGEGDIIRTMLMETNPWLLAVTAIVSLLHTVFDFLAFKNDITFFKGKRSMEGLSIRSMLVNTFFQAVILLYLIDNETSFMIVVSNGIGLAIECWKITKAVKVSFRDGKLSWTEEASYRKSRTKEYDDIAATHLLFVTMPLVAGYGFYSLRHHKHRGWYSWILNTLVGFIYMFGFVMMTPQLFINYKLQSVAHLNWRTMSYKCMNTFVDDLFAFVIKMPIMHRIACLRDDLVFFIFLYQRRIYRTDYTRVNEYGQCSQPTEEMIADSTGTKLDGETTLANSVKADESSGSTIRQRRGARDKHKKSDS